MSLSMRIPAKMMEELQSHLFPGDGDEHGAVIAASVLTTERGTRLLAHRLFIAEDGVDYVEGQRGYRMLTAGFVMDSVMQCADLGMAYLAVHCHGGSDRVAFSSDDMASHERGYQALLDIVDGPPVGGLVFARNAVAGDIWLPNGQRHVLEELTVAGRPVDVLRPEPRPKPARADERYDRQARLFGDRGQEILKRQKVGVIGVGGAGSLIVEYLSRLGVGQLLVVDPQRLEPSNMSRVVGSRRRDLRPWLTGKWVPPSVRRYFQERRSRKIDIAERVAREAQSGIEFQGYPNNITASAVADDLRDCDYLFLAADSMQARLVFNALVHQYLIPGIQMGVKVQVNQRSGDIVDLFTVVRPVQPGMGCLWCNGLIIASRLQEEATSDEQRKRQRYVEDDDVLAPSVISLNAMAASRAVNDYLMSTVGLLEKQELFWTREDPSNGEVIREYPRQDADCRECTEAGRLGKGPTRGLPVSK